MSREALDAFRQVVFADPHLQALLRDIVEEGDFCLRVVQLAQERSLPVTAVDVTAALLEGRRALLLAWL